MKSISYTIKELQAIIIARDLQDGEVGAAGVAASIPMAGMLLARRMHAPNLMISGELFTNPWPRRLWDSMLDDRAMHRCEAVEGFEELFGHSHRGLDFFFHSGIQCDAYGNLNLHVVGNDFYRPKFRGPGVANISYAVTSKRFYILASTHSVRNFVKKVDFITIPGHLDGPESKAAAGLHHEGPRYIITPLAVFDFEPSSLRARVKSVHEGFSLEEVVERTGFELIIPDRVEVTPPPTEMELKLLREIDQTGLLRQ